MKKKLSAIIPFALILLCILIFYLTVGLHFFNFDTIQQLHLKWKSFVIENPVRSAMYFMGVYILSVVLVIPDSTFLTLLGGFLFPMPLALAYACISETIGATIFFLAFKLAYVETLGKKESHPLYRLQKRIHEDQACYLLFLRFSHLLPFWLINVGAGLFHLRTITFIWTTLIGTFPLIFFLVEGAEGLSKYMQTHTHFEFKQIFTAQVKIALIGLGALSLLPVLYKRFKR